MRQRQMVIVIGIAIVFIVALLVSISSKPSSTQPKGTQAAYQSSSSEELTSPEQPTYQTYNDPRTFENIARNDLMNNPRPMDN